MTPIPANPCVAFEQTAQSVLDGDVPPTALDVPHLTECPPCRELAGSVQLLQSALASPRTFPQPVPPPGFAADVVASALYDRRRRLRRTWAARAGAVAAALGLAAYLGTGSAPVDPPPIAKSGPVEIVAVPKEKPARVADKFAEAGEALASLTRRTADETLTPTLGLLPMVEPVVAVVPMPELTPATDDLSGLPSAAKVGLEPVAAPARRAWAVFVRDTGLGKPSS